MIWTPALARRRRRSGASVFNTITDSFNRADNALTLGNTDTGQAWIALNGTWGIGSNRARLVTPTTLDCAVVDAGRANCSVQVTFAVAENGQRLAFRATDGNNCWLVDGNTATGWTLYKVVAGSPIQVGSTYAVAMASNDVVKATLLGNDVTIFVNAVSAITGSDAFNASATKHGIGTGSIGGLARWDVFSIAA